MEQAQTFKQNNESNSAFKFFGVLIACAFIFGAVAMGASQWLHPKIGDAIAAFEIQKARQLQLQNDQTEESLNRQHIENKNWERLTGLAIKKQEESDKQDLENRQELSKRAQDNLISLATIFGTLLGGIGLGVCLLAALKWLGILDVAQQLNMPFANQEGLMQPVPKHTSRHAVPTPSPAFPNQVRMREQSPDEKERYHSERDRARRREWESRRFGARRASQFKTI